MSRGPPSPVAPQGVVTKPGKLPYSEIERRQRVDARRHLYPMVALDGVFKLNKGEPLLAYRDAVATADGIEVWSSLNGLFADDYEFQIYREKMLPPMDEFDARREYLYSKLRCVGVVQNDTSFSLANPQTNGPGVTIQKAGTVTFKWMQTNPAQEGQWVVWRLPDLKLRSNPTYRNAPEDEGRIIAELVPIETTAIFPNRDHFVRILGLDGDLTEQPQPRQRGKFEHGHDLAYDFERFVHLVSVHAVAVATGKSHKEADDLLSGKTVGGKFKRNVILHDVLKPNHEDVMNHPVQMRDLAKNGAVEFFVAVEAQVYKTLDRVVGVITKGGRKEGNVDMIVAKRPLD